MSLQGAGALRQGNIRAALYPDDEPVRGRGLVDGRKLHVDASLIEADAAKDSGVKGPPELIAALKRAYHASESKLAHTSTSESYQAVNDRIMSRSDPDAAVVRHGGGEASSRKYLKALAAIHRDIVNELPQLVAPKRARSLVPKDTPAAV
jgi:hypothetical protein